MGEIDWDWVGMGALCVGAAAVLWGVTNGRIQLKLNAQTSIEERLARYPASAGAIVIKAQRRRALMRMLPGIILAAPLVLAAQFLPAHRAAALLCKHLGPAEAAHWLLRMLFPGLPLLFAVAALFAVRLCAAPGCSGAERHHCGDWLARQDARLAGPDADAPDGGPLGLPDACPCPDL
jgi:hypothetical protein